VNERQLLETGSGGDEDAFARLVEPHRRALHAHCYRMLGSVQDAEDALQDTLLRAWRGLARFEGRSSLRSWLYTIATNTCLRAIERRPKRCFPSTTARRPTRTIAWACRWSNRSGTSPIPMRGSASRTAYCVRGTRRLTHDDEARRGVRGAPVARSAGWG
jgi:RNA polymerase sigma factor (sigma-70 family)